MILRRISGKINCFRSLLEKDSKDLLTRNIIKNKKTAFSLNFLSCIFKDSNLVKELTCTNIPNATKSVHLLSLWNWDHSLVGRLMCPLPCFPFVQICSKVINISTTNQNFVTATYIRFDSYIPLKFYKSIPT